MKAMKITKKEGSVSICENSKGNGADWFTCKITGQRCPHQHWCINLRHFEFLGSAQGCKHYKKQK